MEAKAAVAAAVVEAAVVMGEAVAAVVRKRV